MKTFDVVVVGGGAAGFFSAINVKDNAPNLSIAILEQAKDVLSKVRISGGGRCNVTNSIWEAKDLVKNYPRGEKELLGPFNKFACGDTMSWFEERGVPLKIEEDGRVFPQSDNSQSITSCLLDEASKYGIKIFTQSKVSEIYFEEDSFSIITNKETYNSKFLVLTPGSSPFFWKLLESKSYTIVPPVPSLFTFNISDKRIKDLMGISIPNVNIELINEKLTTSGPLLITHWGLSGPSILKLSAWGAFILNKLNYNFRIRIDFIPEITINELQTIKQNLGGKTVLANPLGKLSIRLWKSLLSITQINEKTKWADISKDGLTEIVKALKEAEFEVRGKSTFKEEFVTAGGVELKNINFNTFESKLHKGLYMAGEILNIDAITGGFNFQAAWTAGYLIGRAIGNK